MPIKKVRGHQQPTTRASAPQTVYPIGPRYVRTGPDTIRLVDADGNRLPYSTDQYVDLSRKGVRTK